MSTSTEKSSLAEAVSLAEDHLPWARTVARTVARGLPPGVDVDELTGAALIALWRCAQRYRPDYQTAGHEQPVPFREFARPYVLGACRMASRRRAYREATHETLEDRHSDPKRDLERQAARDQIGRVLRRVRRGLTPLQERLLQVHYDDDRMLKEAAAELGITETWASIQHRKALRQLRCELLALGINTASVLPRGTS